MALVPLIRFDVRLSPGSRHARRQVRVFDLEARRPATLQLALERKRSIMIGQKSACGRLPPTAPVVRKQELSGREGVAAARAERAARRTAAVLERRSSARYSGGGTHRDRRCSPMSTARPAVSPFPPPRWPGGAARAAQRPPRRSVRLRRA